MQVKKLVLKGGLILPYGASGASCILPCNLGVLAERAGNIHTASTNVWLYFQAICKEIRMAFAREQLREAVYHTCHEYPLSRASLGPSHNKVSRILSIR